MLTLACALSAVALLAVVVFIAIQSAMDGGLVVWDARVTESVVTSRTVLGSRIFWGFTLLGVTPVVIVLTVTVATLLAVWGRRTSAVLFVVGVGVAAGVSSLLKFALHRTRPSDALALIETPSSHSLPSGHALVMGVFFGLLVLIVLKMWAGRRETTEKGVSSDRRNRFWAVWAVGAVIFALGVVGAIGFSRVYLGVHWMSDVIAGWCMAGVLLILAWSVLRVWERNRWRPGDGTLWGNSASRAAVLVALIVVVVVVLILAARAKPLLV